MSEDEKERSGTASTAAEPTPPARDDAPASRASAETTGSAVADPPASSESETGGEGPRMDLPKWNRARVKRKAPADAPQDDAFQGGMRKAGRFTIERAPLVIAGIVLVAAIIAGVQWMLSAREARRAEATRVLATAAGDRARGQVADVEALTKDRKHPFPVPLFETEEAQAARVGETLTKLGEEADGSPADQAAELVRAARAMDERKFEEAAALYRGFLEAHAEHELAFLAREGLVLALEAAGDRKAALEAVEPLGGREGDFYRDLALYHKARLLEAEGQTEEAKKVYAQYVAEYPLTEPSLARQQVIERLQTVAPELVPEAAASALPPTAGALP